MPHSKRFPKSGKKWDVFFWKDIGVQKRNLSEPALAYNVSFHTHNLMPIL